MHQWITGIQCDVGLEFKLVDCVNSKYVRYKLSQREIKRECNINVNILYFYLFTILKVEPLYSGTDQGLGR